MRFRINESGELKWQEFTDITTTVRELAPISSAYIIDIPTITHKLATGEYHRKLSYAGMAIGGGGVFWSAFLTYIFPWMLDIAKVFCAIKIAQAFYNEKRGGRDEGSGVSAIVQYGKWYVLFLMIPWFTELIDQVGGNMFHELKTNPIPVQKP